MSSFATDRISNLPCNVIDDILKFLPLRDAVRTSILSRGWRYKWLTIPYIVFDQNLKQSLSGDFNIESIVYQVLLVHKGPIVKFIYNMINDDINRCLAIDHLFHFLSNRHIEELKLFISKSGIHLPMPHHLFSFDNLRRLFLGNCSLRIPPEFQGFARLVMLHLGDVVTKPGELTRFISKCPMLKHLVLRYNLPFPDLEIDAPSLKSFNICIAGRLSSICFKNTSLIEEVLVSFREHTSRETLQGSRSNLIDCFSQLSSIKVLKLNHHFLQLFGRDGLPQKLPNNLSHLWVVGLHIEFARVAQVSSVVCLIRSSPNLQSLQISSKTTHEGDMETAAQFLKAQQKGELTLTHLIDVLINGFSGSEPEMEFVKLILSAATALKKLRLEDATEEGYRMFKKLAGFRRASSEAEIIFDDNFRHLKKFLCFD